MGLILAIDQKQEEVYHIYLTFPANIGAPNFRARQLPVQPVGEQQDVTLPQDNMLVNLPMMQHNTQQQDNTAYNRRQYDQLQVMSPNQSDEDALMVNPPHGTSK